MNHNNYKKSQYYAIFLGIICFITNISQMPSLVNTGITRIVALPSWLLVAIVLLFKDRIKFRKNIMFIAIISYVFITSVIALTIFTKNDYISSSLVYPYFLSIFIFILGYLLSYDFNYYNIKFIVYGYITSTIIIALDIYIKYFSSGYNWLDRGYAYASKNSVSQILLTGLILLFVYFTPKKIIGKIVRIGSVIFITLIIFMLKSRGSIIGIIIMGIVIILSKKNIKLKIITIAIFCTFIVAININENLYDIVVKGILLGGREAENLNDISSGRWDMILNFPKYIENQWILGIGNGYIENFLLSAILQHGIFIGILIILISIWPILWMVKNLDLSNKFNISVIIIAITYFTNGLFEELAPFGPGVKCYFLWLSFGILYNWKIKNKKIGGDRYE